MNQRNNIFIKTFSLAVWVLITVGCTSMSLTGLYRLSQLDPLTADPSQIKVAIKTDRIIEVKDGAAHINFSYKSNDGSIDISDNFYVVIDRNNTSAQLLFDDIKSTDTITVLSLTSKDGEKFQQNQRIVAKHKQEDKKGTGSFGIGLDEFCLPDPMPERPITVDLYLQTNKSDGFFAFLSGIDIKEQAKRLNSDREKITCQQS